MEKRNKGLSNKYISDLIIVLKNMTRYAARVHHCVNPIADIELPKKEKHELDLYNKNEQNRLKSALLTNMDLTKFAIMLALYTGVRIGELCGLKWSDIDLYAKTIRIERTIQRIRVSSKSNRTELIVSTPKSRTSVRTIPLPEFLVRMLKAFKPSSADTFIVTGNVKLPDPRTMQYRFKSLLTKIDLRKLNFHSLRHLFATNCVELGFDVKTLSEILGHSSVEITIPVPNSNTKPTQYLPTIILISKGRFSCLYARNLPYCFLEALLNLHLLILISNHPIQRNIAYIFSQGKGTERKRTIFCDGDEPSYLDRYPSSTF